MAVFVLPLLSATLLAQSTGAISGRVYDSATGKSLQGAIVRVQGTSGLDYSADDGRFHISGLPAGPVTVEVEYVGLDPLTQQVTITPGTTTSFDAGLKSNVLVLDAFTVSETARGQSLAVNLQRTASGIVNIVSEETFGKMQGGNIGNALHYLPSITMNEDQDGQVGGINIRGVESEYNAVLIDGNRVSSRGFDTRNISGDGITNVEVIKAPTPDRDGDAIGGMVNLKTRSAFQRDGRWTRLDFNATLNDLVDKWGYGGSIGYSDIFSVLGKEKNLGVALSLSYYDSNRYSKNADIDWERVPAEGSPPAWNIAEQEQAAGRPLWFMEATHWEWDTRETQNYGANASFDFRFDEFNSIYVRPTWGAYKRQGITFEDDIDVDTRYQETGSRKTYAFITPTTGRGTPGSSGSRGRYQWIGTDDEREQTLYSVAFGGRNERADSLLTYDFVASRRKTQYLTDLEFEIGAQPNNPYILWEYETVAQWKGDIIINQLTDYDLSDPSLISYGEMADATELTTEDTLSAQIDWERNFSLSGNKSFTFKTGAKYRNIESENDENANVWETDEDFPYDAVVDPTNEVLFMKRKYHNVYPKRARALLNSNPELFELLVDDTLADSALADYKGDETTTAAYVMGTFRSGRHTIVGGVRWEKVEWNSTKNEADFSFVPEIDEQGEEQARRVLDAIRVAKFGSSYDNFLPGIHFRHELTDRLILRESYNRSYGKPRLSQLTMGYYKNEDGDIEEGNPFLEPAISDNYDIQLEYYTKNHGLYSIGVFRKDIKDFTYEHTLNFNDLDANGKPIPISGGELEYTQPRNGSSAKNTGVELMARQQLVFLPGFLKGLSVDLSATFLNTEAVYPNRTDRDDLPLPGFSDTVYTARLGYDWGNFRSRLSYRYREDYVEGLGADITEDEFFGAQERVDAEISYRFGKGIRLYANGTNLSNRPLVSYQGLTYFTEDTSYHGRKYTFGVEYEF